MRDPALGSFTLNNRDAVGNGAWWGGEPIWVTAERAGMPTATYFWPGSEAEIKGVRPTRWKLFDTKVPLDERVDTVVDWFSESEATRPRLATLYLETIDNASHNFSPESPEVNKTLSIVDAAIGRLLDGLASRQRLSDVDVIVTADHGMAPVLPDNVIAVEDMVDPSIATVVSTGQSVGFNPVPGKERDAEARLVGAHKQFDCWPKAKLPARWRYGTHPRVPAIVCQMHEGWDAGTRAALAKRPKGVTRGSHGFDPALASMRAIFIANGPSFKRGVVLPAIESVDVYPLLTRLLGLKVPSQDGNPNALAGALR
jgi:predicted AlkP superfamily pyrophosphatase or phosphodiesterase